MAGTLIQLHAQLYTQPLPAEKLARVLLALNMVVLLIAACVQNVEQEDFRPTHLLFMPRQGWEARESPGAQAHGKRLELFYFIEVERADLPEIPLREDQDLTVPLRELSSPPQPLTVRSYVEVPSYDLPGGDDREPLARKADRRSFQDGRLPPLYIEEAFFATRVEQGQSFTRQGARFESWTGECLTPPPETLIV